MTQATRNFTRRMEDFVCEHCGLTVEGNGYTNHCPRCLYSKHVDLSPGDRESRCLGLMAPMRLEPFGEGVKVLHRCERCGVLKKNRTAADDSFEALLHLSEQESKTNTHKK